MKCVFCGGMLEEKVVTFTYEEGDKYLFVEHVPAQFAINAEREFILLK